MDPPEVGTFVHSQVHSFSSLSGLEQIHEHGQAHSATLKLHRLFNFSSRHRYHRPTLYLKHLPKERSEAELVALKPFPELWGVKKLDEENYEAPVHKIESYIGVHDDIVMNEYKKGNMEEKVEKRSRDVKQSLSREYGYT